ncbi:hypothetical protein [Aeromicrobium alkaliterrae]|uniref:Exo-alpha-sialidase n=1 Tax=Aeromicrobium alkaliterrae TaxID=302168 RepID=A0ABN2JZW3_9ACTN
MSRRRALPLLALFLIVDVVAVVAVYRHVNQSPPPSDISIEATPTPEQVDNEQTAFEFDPSSAAVLDITNDGTYLWATRGSCDGVPATVAAGTDFGATTAPVDPQLQTVLSAAISPEGDFVLVGTEADCVPVQLRSVDGGRTWDADDEISLWYPSPTDVRAVVAPTGLASQPGCTVTSISQIDATFSRVTCVDGVVRGTGNAGAEWVVLGRLDNIRTATFTTFDTGYALARFEGCAAFLFVTSDSGATWTDQSCIVGDPARAVAASDTVLVGVVGTDPQVFVSDDGGAEFRRP